MTHLQIEILQLFAERQQCATRQPLRGLHIIRKDNPTTKLYRQQEWRWKRVLAGKCETCGGRPLATKRLCETCRGVYNAGRQARRAAKKEKRS